MGGEAIRTIDAQFPKRRFTVLIETPAHSFSVRQNSLPSRHKGADGLLPVSLSGPLLVSSGLAMFGSLAWFSGLKEIYR